MSELFDSLKLRDITIRNRLGVSPMCMYSSQAGRATDWHLVHLGARAVGGWGLIMAEATAVTPEGRISPEDAGLWDDGQIEPLRRITHFIKTHGGTPGLQLAHAGRKASTARLFSVPQPGKPLSPAEGGWTVVAPSPIAFDPQAPVPHELSVVEIKAIQSAFAAAAARALNAGYDLLEIHAAHGYLLNEFLSPLTNQRTDAYGGSFNNCIRMLMETVSAVRQVWPQRLPLAVRLSCVDWVEGGWTLEDSVAVARALKAADVDLVDCSSGAVVPQAHIPVGPGFQVPFAHAIRRDSGILTAAVGMITEAHQAAEIIATGKADLVLMGRQALRAPYFPIQAAATLGAKRAIALPPQYARA
ncbi:MAG: NADH:flavin oxidoreductase/NADH oxidase [Phycisphaerae bacterium]|nr:NADH:flavin oxidoreductase/NADH oxidase [Phycisphaerae bacterium]